MIESSVTYPAPTPQVEAIEREIARLRRARPHLASRIDRAENIIVTQLSCSGASRPVRVLIHQDGTRSFTVHSCSKLRKVYTVSSDFRCECPDTRRRSETPPACKHSIAAYVISRALLSIPASSKPVKTSPCSGCGERVANRELTEVQDWHGSLSYFEGDMLCAVCFDASDCW